MLNKTPDIAKRQICVSEPLSISTVKAAIEFHNNYLFLRLNKRRNMKKTPQQQLFQLPWNWPNGPYRCRLSLTLGCMNAPEAECSKYCPAALGALQQLPRLKG